MTDQENNLVGSVNANGSKICDAPPSIEWRFLTRMAKGKPHHSASSAGNDRTGPLMESYNGRRINSSYDLIRQQGRILLGDRDVTVLVSAMTSGAFINA